MLIGYNKFKMAQKGRDRKLPGYHCPEGNYYWSVNDTYLVKNEPRTSVEKCSTSKIRYHM